MTEWLILGVALMGPVALAVWSHRRRKAARAEPEVPQVTEADGNVEISFALGGGATVEVRFPPEAGRDVMPSGDRKFDELCSVRGRAMEAQVIFMERYRQLFYELALIGKGGIDQGQFTYRGDAHTTDVNRVTGALRRLSNDLVRHDLGTHLMREAKTEPLKLVRLLLYQRLFEYGDLRVLEEAREDRHFDIRFWAVREMDSSGRDAIEELCEDPDLTPGRLTGVLRHAADVLTDESLVQLVRAQFAWMNGAHLQALIGFTAEWGLRPLSPALRLLAERDEGLVARDALIALAHLQIEGPSFFLRFLEHQDAAMRETAVHSLGLCGDAAVLPHLERVRNRDPKLRAAAEAAIRRLRKRLRTYGGELAVVEQSEGAGTLAIAEGGELAVPDEQGGE